MAFTVGNYGLSSLLSLGKLIACFYTTSILFVVLMLGIVMRVAGLGILKFLRYIKEEILVVLGTSSSESALPLMMRKMERLGCSKPVVGLVVPMGYSFNLDGTSIYLTLATLFIAQATNTHVSLGQELEILAVLLLTSKGAAAVTGGGFITLAATLSAVGNIPVAGLTLLLGVDRFMSEARAITNLIGNGVASVAVSRWEGELDVERARAVLNGEPVPDVEAANDALEATPAMSLGSAAEG
jgi:aerobic C4-dicarboxylate transport protein